MGTHIHLLGPVGATFDGDALPLGAPMQRALLAMLALNANSTVTTERLIRGLWHEAPETAPKMVQGYVSQLRKALATGDARIVTHGRGYELAVSPDAVDALRFEHLVSSAEQLTDGEAGDRVHDALALWRGPPLADIGDEPFADPEVRRLDELWLRAREVLIDADLAAGREAGALAELDALIADHPLRERLHGQRMLALYRSGRQADALEAYRTARRTLVDEVGVEPGPELHNLHQSVLSHDPALDRPRPGRPTAPRGPEPPAVAGRPRARPRTALAAAAVLLIAAGAAAFLISRSGSNERLPAIAENSIAAMGTDGRSIRGQYDVGRAPVALAAGGGYVWAANQLDGTVSRVDPADGHVLSVDVGGAPSALAFGAGSVWVADSSGGIVTQVDPRLGRVVQRIQVDGGPRGLAVGGGSLWIAAALDGNVQRVAPRTGTVVQRIAVGGTPTALAFGAGGLWVTSEAEGTLLRVEPRSRRVLDSVNVGNGPAAVAVGAGAVWTANRQDGTISRVDPATARVTDTVQVGRGPGAIVVSGNAVWTANGDSGTLTRVDARTRRVTATIAVGSTPAGLVPFGGRLWVSALPARSSHRGGTLRVRSVASDFCACMDPADYDELIWPEVGIAYDGLVGYRRTAGVAGGTIVPALATTVPRPSTDGLTYAFRLRPGVRYSDGSPLHMADVRASFERMIQVNAGPVPADLYSALPGAAECARGRKPCDLSKAIVGDEASRSVTFHLLRPDPDLPHKLALPLASIVPARTARRLPTKLPPPGTGPYRVASFDAHHGMRLVRNRYFRSPSPDARPDGLTDAIAVTFAKPDPKADVASVERSGQDLVRLDTHYFEPASRSLVRRLVARDAGRLTFENQLATDYMFLNVHEPPFDDVRVRRALNYATDRGAVAALAGGPYTARPTCQILPPGEPGYRPFCPWTLHPSRAGGWVAPDVDRARSLIAASHTAGQRVVVWAAGPRADVARYFAGLLRRLGYRSSVRIVPSPDAYFPAISDSRRHVQIGVYGWIADYLSASTSIVPNFSCAALVPNSPDNNNPSQFCDRRADGLIDRALARGSADPGTVAGLWRKVDRRVVNDAPVVPLVNTRTAVLLSPRTGNVQQHPFWGTLLEQVWVR